MPTADRAQGPGPSSTRSYRALAVAAHPASPGRDSRTHFSASTRLIPLVTSIDPTTNPKRTRAMASRRTLMHSLGEQSARAPACCTPTSRRSRSPALCLHSLDKSCRPACWTPSPGQSSSSRCVLRPRRSSRAHLLAECRLLEDKPPIYWLNADAWSTMLTPAR